MVGGCVHDPTHLANSANGGLHVGASILGRILGLARANISAAAVSEASDGVVQREKTFVTLISVYITV